MISEQRAVGAGGVLAAAVLWGTVGPAQVVAASAASPGALGVARLLVGGLVLAVPMAWVLPWRQLLDSQVWPWMLAAAVSTGIYQATFLYAVARTGAALGTTIALGCAPVATGVFSLWWLRERPGRAWMVGTLAAIVGCVVILAPSGSTQVDVLGVVFAVVSGTCYGGYTVAAKKFLACDVPPMATVAATLVLGGLLLAPLIAVFPEHLLEVNSLLLIAWIGVAATAAAYMCFVAGLRTIRASTAGTLSLAEPLTAALLGVVVLGERLSVNAALGCLLLFTGLVVVSIQGRVQPPRWLRGRLLSTRTARDDRGRVPRRGTVRPPAHVGEELVGTMPDTDASPPQPRARADI